MPVDGDFLRHACARPQASDGCLNVDDGRWSVEVEVEVFDAGSTAVPPDTHGVEVPEISISPCSQPFGISKQRRGTASGAR